MNGYTITKEKGNWPFRYQVWWVLGNYPDFLLTVTLTKWGARRAIKRDRRKQW